jgi:hypothetical protein
VSSPAKALHFDELSEVIQAKSPIKKAEIKPEIIPSQVANKPQFELTPSPVRKR